MTVAAFNAVSNPSPGWAKAQHLWLLYANRAYATAAEMMGLNRGYSDGVRGLAQEFELYRERHGAGDPDRGRHRPDDSATIEKMRTGRSA